MKFADELRQLAEKHDPKGQVDKVYSDVCDFLRWSALNLGRTSCNFEDLKQVCPLIQVDWVRDEIGKRLEKDGLQVAFKKSSGPTWGIGLKESIVSWRACEEQQNNNR